MCVPTPEIFLRLVKMSKRLFKLKNFCAPQKFSAIGCGLSCLAVNLTLARQSEKSRGLAGTHKMPGTGGILWHTKAISSAEPSFGGLPDFSLWVGQDFSCRADLHTDNKIKFSPTGRLRKRNPRSNNPSRLWP